MSSERDVNAMLDGAKFFENLVESTWKRITEYFENKKANKETMDMLKEIMGDGKKLPVLVKFAKEPPKYAPEMLDMIKEYNKNHKRAEKIPFVEFRAKDGRMVLMTNEYGVEKINELREKFLEKENIKHLEVTAQTFGINNNGKTVFAATGITANEMNLIKQKPWQYAGYNEALTSFAYSFTSVPKSNGTYDVYVNEKDALFPYREGYVTENGKFAGQKSGLYEDILISKAILSGESGKLLSDRMNYERETLNEIRKSILETRAKPENPIYITSSTDGGRYMVISKGKCEIHAIGKDGNMLDRKELSYDIDAFKSVSDFENKCLAAFKSFNNPIKLDSLSECVKHCITGEPITECINNRGEKITLENFDTSTAFANASQVEYTRRLSELAKFESKLNENKAPENCINNFEDYAKECERITNQTFEALNAILEEKDENGNLILEYAPYDDENRRYVIEETVKTLAENNEFYVDNEEYQAKIEQLVAAAYDNYKEQNDLSKAVESLKEVNIEEKVINKESFVQDIENDPKTNTAKYKNNQKIIAEEIANTDLSEYYNNPNFLDETDFDGIKDNKKHKNYEPKEEKKYEEVVL